MKTRTMVVKGVPSSDCECWCFMVTRRDYIRITGLKPSTWDLGTRYGRFRYRLYPGSLISRNSTPMRLTVKCEDMEQ